MRRKEKRLAETRRTKDVQGQPSAGRENFIRQTKKRRRKISRLAYRDQSPVMGLFNRRGGRRLLGRDRRRTSRSMTRGLLLIHGEG